MIIAINFHFKKYSLLSFYFFLTLAMLPTPLSTKQKGDSSFHVILIVCGVVLPCSLHHHVDISVLERFLYREKKIQSEPLFFFTFFFLNHRREEGDAMRCDAKEGRRRRRRRRKRVWGLNESIDCMILLRCGCGLGFVVVKENGGGGGQF